MTDALNTGNFTVIDTETTGLSWQTCEVIEIGAVRFRDWKPVEEYDVLLKPKARIPYFITNLTGITNEMVKYSPSLADVTEQFLEFLGEDDIVGHNLSFDLNFLSSGGVPMYSMDFVFHDTMKIGRKKLKKGEVIQNHQLATLCEFFGIENSRAHRAADDARATGKVFKRLVAYDY